jgi:uncharacterized protein (TIGR02597 family)
MIISSVQFRALSMAILCAIAPVVHAQTTATTVPAGFITRTIPAAANASTPSNTTVSIPLYRSPDHVSAVATLDSSNQVTLSGATWTAGQFSSASAPRLLRVKTSTAAPANVGKFLLISANTTNQLTLSLPAGVANVNSELSVGDTCEIVPANTLGSVFGTASNPPQLTGGATPDVADNVLLWDGSTWLTYFWTGTLGTPNNIWKRTGNIDRSNTIIYPDEAAFVIRRDTTSAATLTLMGTVPSTSERTDIAASGSTFISNRFPVDATLGGLGLQNIPGWLAGATPDVADKVYIWDVALATWATYFWTGTVGTPNNIWKKTGNIDRSNTPIPVGTGVFVSHAGSAVTLTQALPYVP